MFSSGNVFTVHSIQALPNKLLATCCLVLQFAAGCPLGSIIGALLRHCPPPLKTRVLAKFVENDHEKLDRLVELHLKYFERVKSTDNRIRAMKEDSKRWVGYTSEEVEEELVLERFGGGLLTLQVLDIIILEVCVNGDPAI
ncbi:hypothetical protein P879_11649 [Paragonimus westermani]|uniref:Beta-catenin-like protein 1 N-terminal domain-containing protein n=1 Tax=Paragonimus westermani TaxID=34504 RepID=A0A8T0D1M1_9TREM|nr:hypothetical protein P879_11649 [Paragonimus westermani]